MKWALMIGTAMALSTVALAADTHVYEVRVYTPNKGRQGDVNALIAKSGAKYMAKHSIELIGAYIPLDPADERVITVVAHKDKASGEKNWAAFQADEGWKADLAAASKDGRAVQSIARIFLSATAYSPPVKASATGNRMFELRTYITTPKNLVNLDARFSNHTIKLFEKHGMTNLPYFHLLEGEKTTCGELLKALAPLGKDGAEVAAESEAAPLALVYFLSHKSTDAMKASFDSFRMDDAWKTVLSESEKKAGGPLTAKNGVKSLPLKATDYSPTK